MLRVGRVEEQIHRPPKLFWSHALAWRLGGGVDNSPHALEHLWQPLQLEAASKLDALLSCVKDKYVADPKSEESLPPATTLREDLEARAKIENQMNLGADDEDPTISKVPKRDSNLN